MKTYSESRIELWNLQNVKKMLAVLWSEQPCELKSLDVALNMVGVGKVRSKNLRWWSRLEVTQFEFWLKWALATVEICVLCGWRFLNHFDIVSETHYKCDTVGCELYRVILWSLLCPETDWKIRVGEQGYVLILTDPKTRCFDVSFLTSICINRLRIFERN